MNQKNTFKKQKVNHARTKRRKRSLKSKDTALRVGGADLASIMARIRKPPKIASSKPEKIKSLLSGSGKLNQRQRRKRDRQLNRFEKC